VSATGLAVQANAANAGGTGGRVTIEAAGDVILDEAQGDAVATGGYGTGGRITVRSYTGELSWMNPVGGERGLHRRAGRHIGRHGQRAALRALDQPAGLPGCGDIQGGHVGAGRGQPDGDGASDPPSGARHQRHLAGQIGGSARRGRHRRRVGRA